MLRLRDMTGCVFGFAISGFEMELVISPSVCADPSLSPPEEPLSSYPELRMVGNLGL
jgi:hypothetical protein